MAGAAKPASGSTPAAQVQAAADAKPLGDVAREIADVLAVLVPPDAVTVRDVRGTEYRLAGSLPARRQIRMVRALDAIKDLAVPKFDAGGASMVAALVRLAGDEQVLLALCEMFAIAHPEAARRALTDHLGVGEIDIGEVESRAGGLADCFAVEELVAALVPFFVRLAARVAAIVGEVAPPAADA